MLYEQALTLKVSGNKDTASTVISDKKIQLLDIPEHKTIAAVPQQNAREKKMHKSAGSFVIFALLLTACSIQVTTFQPGSTPTSSPIDILATQVSIQPTPTPLAIVQPTVPALTGVMLYFWPAIVPPEMQFNSARSLTSENGYVIEFTNPQTGTAMVLRTGAAADLYPYCAGQTSPYQIRGVEGCSSMGTGGGAGLEWKENGIHYAVGGIGNNLETIIQFASNLEVIDSQTWQQKFTEAAAMSLP